MHGWCCIYGLLSSWRPLVAMGLSIHDAVLGEPQAWEQSRYGIRGSMAALSLYSGFIGM